MFLICFAPSDTILVVIRDPTANVFCDNVEHEVPNVDMGSPKVLRHPHHRLVTLDARAHAWLCGITRQGENFGARAVHEAIRAFMAGNVLDGTPEVPFVAGRAGAG